MTEAAEPAPVVWLAEASAEAERSLDRWAKAHGLVLRPPPAPEPHVEDGAAAERVEEQLSLAREALSAGDAKAADRALLAAERETIDHPEMPQAAWLRAEVERGWASRWTRIEPSDPERAGRAWSRAAALDGGRVAGIGEPGAGTSHLGVGATPESVVATLEGTGSILIDGVPAKAGALRIAPGEHAVLVRAGDVTVWAGWVGIGEGSRIALPWPVDCSRADWAPGRRTQCRRWVAARPAARSEAIQVAWCERDRCEPFREFAPQEKRSEPRPSPEERRRAPAWLVWGLGAAAVLAAAGLTLYATGALEGPPKETRFVEGGIRITSKTFSPAAP